MEETNWLALVVAAIATFAVGFIWYNPKVFGSAWMKEVGLTEEKAQQGNMPMIFGLSLVFAFMAAMVLNYLVSHPDENLAPFVHGAYHGAFLATMIGLPILGTNALYEQRSFKYIIINWGYWLVNFALMGGILAAWR